LPGWKREERRKQAAEGSLGSPEKRTRTKDEDEHDWDMALIGYSCLATITLSLRDEGHSLIEGPRINLAPTGCNPDQNSHFASVFVSKSRDMRVGKIRGGNLLWRKGLKVNGLRKKTGFGTPLACRRRCLPRKSVPVGVAHSFFGGSPSLRTFCGWYCEFVLGSETWAAA
jgi:hypothetical protein